MRLYRVTAPGDEASARAVADALEPLAPLARDVHDLDDGSGLWEVGALFRDPPDPAGLALVAALHGMPDFRTVRIEDRDWVAEVRAGLTPVEAGRFVVHGSHDRRRIPPHRVGLQIEAAEAFGTGHHASTQGCLLALDGLARKRFVARRVADIGAGTGVLAMAAAATWPAVVVAGDIDPLATATARTNAAANRLGRRIACVTADGLRHPRLHGCAPYDLVLANILAGPLRRMAPEVARHQRRGGVAVLSGILARQAPGVAAVYHGRGYLVLRVVRVGDWTTLVLRRP